MKLGRLKRHCNNMGTLMEALVKYADSDNTKDPILIMRNRRRERRMAVRRDSSTTREAMGIMVSVKRIQILWLMLMCSVVRVNRPSAVGR